MPRDFRVIMQSIKFYRKPVMYQVVIIVLLSAVITGSLLTGSSVRQSLKKSASERLGNADFLISSGIRAFFDSRLVQRLKDSQSVACAGIIETSGFCQALNSQKAAFNTHIFGIGKDFFVFQGHDSLIINSGEIAVNKRLADYLGLKPGDQLIIRFKTISDIPADVPFALCGDAGKSVVLG